MDDEECAGHLPPARPRFRDRVADSKILGFALSVAPVPGGDGVAYLLSEHANVRRFARLEQFVEDVASSAAALEARLDSPFDGEFVRSDDFLATVEWALGEVARSADVEKLEYVRSFLVSSALRTRPENSLRSLFASYISRLSGDHLIVLSRLADLQRDVALSDRLGRTRIGEIVPVDASRLAELFEGSRTRLCRALCIDLCGMGLLVDWADLVDSTLRQREFTVSDSGSLFDRFVSSRWMPIND